VIVAEDHHLVLRHLVKEDVQWQIQETCVTQLVIVY
jgi:hypothetical protein